MQPPVTDCVFDISEWFFETAENDGDPLQPQRLQNLMFLAQGYFAALSHGRRLMPCIFIATEHGPVEPNSYRLYAKGRPDVVRTPLSPTVVALLDGIWRKFGSFSAEFLSRMVTEHEPYVVAFSHGKNTEIDLEAMRNFYGNTNGKSAPSAQTFDKPRIMRSQTGKPVTVKKWEPKKR